MAKTFGEALKDARVAKRRTLREVGDRVGYSVSYLSDIEQDRRGAPDLEKVRKIQEFLEVRDNSLVDLASRLRTKLPTEITQRIQRRPRLEALLARADNLDDDGLEKLIAAAGEDSRQ
jgi:transcriptional regulator with XRE-family HTH domain